MFVKLLVKFDLEFDLKLEIFDGKNLGLFDLPGKHENFGANFGANFGENFVNFVSYFAICFGNFVQQKGSAKGFQEQFRWWANLRKLARKMGWSCSYCSRLFSFPATA